MKMILLLALCLTIMSCSTTKDPNKEFNGNVKVLKEFTYLAFEKFGEPAVGDLVFSYVEEYDSDGKKTKVEHDDGIVFKSEYSNKGQKVKMSYYNKDGELKIVSKFEYNDKGQEVKDSAFDIDGKLIYVYKYEYNDKRQEVKKSSFDKDGKPTEVSKFEYNDKGQKIRSSHYNEDGELERALEYKYTKFDDKNNWIEQEAYTKNKILSIVKREFIYW